MYAEADVDPSKVTSIRQMVEETSLDPLRDAEKVKSDAVVFSGLGTELSQHYVASLPISLSGDSRLL